MIRAGISPTEWHRARIAPTAAPCELDGPRSPRHLGVLGMRTRRVTAAGVANRHDSSDGPGRSRHVGAAATPEDRRRVLRTLFPARGGGSTLRFALLVAFSVVIAVMGLSANFAAVVIGAMLIAPLMTPVLGLAEALVVALGRHVARGAATVGAEIDHRARQPRRTPTGGTSLAGDHPIRGGQFQHRRNHRRRRPGHRQISRPPPPTAAVHGPTAGGRSSLSDETAVRLATNRRPTGTPFTIGRTSRSA
jgi:hypothetical protein